MVVFYPSGGEIKEHLEDSERTLITIVDGLPEKVYAKLDGDVLTFFLASEY
ncbi:MAG: hypothetical protein ABIH76_07110 [Candidatus Bathyarchaeota archaeon]